VKTAPLTKAAEAGWHTHRRCVCVSLSSVYFTRSPQNNRGSRSPHAWLPVLRRNQQHCIVLMRPPAPLRRWRKCDWNDGPSACKLDAAGACPLQLASGRSTASDETETCLFSIGRTAV